MSSSDLLNYSLSFFLIVAGAGLIINFVMMIGILMLVKDAVRKVRDVALSAYEMEQKAKKNILYFVLHILDLVT